LRADLGSAFLNLPGSDTSAGSAVVDGLHLAWQLGPTHLPQTRRRTRTAESGLRYPSFACRPARHSILVKGLRFKLPPTLSRTRRRSSALRVISRSSFLTRLAVRGRSPRVGKRRTPGSSCTVDRLSSEGPTELSHLARIHSTANCPRSTGSSSNSSHFQRGLENLSSSTTYRRNSHHEGFQLLGIARGHMHDISGNLLNNLLTHPASAREHQSPETVLIRLNSAQPAHALHSKAGRFAPSAFFPAPTRDAALGPDPGCLDHKAGSPHSSPTDAE